MPACARLEGSPLARSLVAVLRDARNPSRRAPQVGHAHLRMTCANSTVIVNNRKFTMIFQPQVERSNTRAC